MITRSLVSVIGLRGTLWETRQTFDATAPAWGAGVGVGLGGEDSGRVGWIIGRAEEWSKGLGNGARAGNVAREGKGWSVHAMFMRF
jgi:hypothetical protein